MTEQDSDWYGPDTATFGDRVSGAREAAGMTQSQMARRLGVKKATLVAWEEDLSEPRANKLSMMAGVLNVSLGWLLTGEGEGTAEPVEVSDETQDLTGILAELNEIRGAMRVNSERAARLEKKLRKMVRGTP